MSALAKLSPAADPSAFTLRLGGAGRWIVEGPRNSCGGIFVSQAAALDFIRREGQALADLSRHARFQPDGERTDAPAAPTMRLVHSEPGGRPH